MGTNYFVFVEGEKVHIGKRSGGWSFVWNFQNNKYDDLSSLLNFISLHDIYDEDSNTMTWYDFFSMAMNWNPINRPDFVLPEGATLINGLVIDEKYNDIIDGLCVFKHAYFR